MEWSEDVLLWFLGRWILRLCFWFPISVSLSSVLYNHGHGQGRLDGLRTSFFCSWAVGFFVSLSGFRFLCRYQVFIIPTDKDTGDGMVKDAGNVLPWSDIRSILHHFFLSFLLSVFLFYLFIHNFSSKSSIHLPVICFSFASNSVISSFVD